MKNLFIIGILAYCLIATSSCSLESRVFKNEPYVRKLLGVPAVLTEHHDSIVTVEISAPDSGYFNAWFECNDSNQVLMRRYIDLKSKGVSTSVKFEKNHLVYDYKTDSARLAKSLIERFGKEKLIPVEVDKPATLAKIATLEKKVAAKNKSIIIMYITVAIMGVIIYLMKHK